MMVRRSRRLGDGSFPRQSCSLTNIAVKQAWMRWNHSDGPTVRRHATIGTVPIDGKGSQMTDRRGRYLESPPWAAVDDAETLRDDADDFEDALMIELQSRLRPVP